MIVLDLAFYHTYMALIALNIATTSQLSRESLELNQAYLSFLKPANIFETHLSDLKKHVKNNGLKMENLGKNSKPKGVILGMFKMDCLALFGRNILALEV